VNCTVFVVVAQLVDGDGEGDVDGEGDGEEVVEVDGVDVVVSAPIVGVAPGSKPV